VKASRALGFLRVGTSILERLLGAALSRERLCEMVQNRTINIEMLRMPSIDAFRARLEEVI
jgi:hypothetical protein